MSLEDQLADPIWRICNLYHVVNKDGVKVPFRPNVQQQRVLDAVYNKGWTRIIILKARQLGFSTLIEIMLLDECIFSRDWAGAIIADTAENAKKLMDRKIKYAYNCMYDEIRSATEITKDNENIFELDNGSSIFAGMRARGGTHQFLHISEIGKIAATDPLRAKEIKTGAFPSVPKDGKIIIESTFEGGKFGMFYDLLMDSMSKPEEEVTEMDFRFMFFPWWEEPQYTLKANERVWNDQFKEYFEELKTNSNIDLTPEQKTWYVVTKNQMGEDMLQEYPSTPQEAISVPIKGAYYAKEIATARVEKRITTVDYDRSLTTYSFWDIGLNDFTSIWVVQVMLNRVHWIDCYQNCDQPPSHYVDWLNDKPYVFTRHFLPWDAGRRIQTQTRVLTYEDMLHDLGMRNTVCVPKTQDKGVGINQLRMLLGRSWFDAKGCEVGVNALEAYRKEFIEERGIYKEQAVHDDSSHYADAARYVAEAMIHGMIEGTSRSVDPYTRKKRPTRAISKYTL